MPSDQGKGPLHDPESVKFKLAGPAPLPEADRGLEESGARAWLGLPVPPGKAATDRTIKTEEAS